MERKEAIEIVRKLYNESLFLKKDKEAIVTLIPEIEESEDEKIRKELIEALKQLDREKCPVDTYQYQDWIAWLEKCGEQKPAEKVEPKFKVGDIITNGKSICKVDENENNKYHGWFGYDKDLSVHYADIPDVENWHKWTIQDAKDGDVLLSSDGSIFIFKEVVDLGCKHYIALAVNRTIQVNDNFEHFWESVDGVCPATKEQRDILIKAMTDAGYTFDFEKKELKKIEPKTAAWTPIDEQRVENLLAIIEGHGYPGEVAWLSSLKNRVQPKQEWSEEDKNMLQSILDEYKSMPTEKRNWLKSLRPQNRWKPSEEQINALYDVLNPCDGIDKEVLCR